MRKLVQMLVAVCMVVLCTQVAFANADKVTVYDGVDLTSVNRLAVGQPLYMPASDKAPTKEELTKLIFDASRVARCSVMSYDDVAASIQRDAKLDITVLDRHKAAKEFKAHVANYADAYIIATVANSSNSKRTRFFFDVYKAGTDELLYTYEIHANSSEDDSLKTFNNLAEQFYKHFERSVEEQQKKADKESK